MPAAINGKISRGAAFKKTQALVAEGRRVL
jgi:hypothetical protein